MENCGGRHNTLLHMPRSVVSPTSDPSASGNGSADERETCATIPSMSKRTLRKVIPVTLCVGEIEIKANALLDSGSTITLLRAHFAQKLGASGPINPVCIQWGDGTESQEKHSILRSKGITFEQIDSGLRA